ncbi:MAG: cupin-like domain-containing protein [Pseudomonadota bacterium]
MLDRPKSYIDQLPPIPERHLAPGQTLSTEDLSGPSPFIVRGLVADWPLVQAAKTSFPALRDYLQKFYNQKPVMISRGPAENRGRIFYKDDMSLNVTIGKSDLNTVLAQISEMLDLDEQDCLYLAATAIDAYFPGMQAENPIELGAHSAYGRIWLGTRTTVAPHNDSQYNLACSVAGHRRFLVFPPEVFRDLYLGPFDNTPAGRVISMVDVHDPDFDKHPRFRQALEQASVADLAPGDAIYMPPLWWHQVDGLDPFNILINYWWRASPAVYGLPEPALDHALLAFRDLPPAERAYWKNMFDHFVFNTDDDTNAHIPKGKRGTLDDMTKSKAQALRAKLLRYFQR